MDQNTMEYLYLADWRRRVAALYAEVRELARTDPVAAWERRRALPARRREERRPRRRSGPRHPHARLQLRLPALLRLRPALGLPPRPTREPAGHRGAGRGADEYRVLSAEC